MPVPRLSHDLLLPLILSLILASATGLFAQNAADAFHAAGVKVDQATELPRHLYFKQGAEISLNDFFPGLRATFALSEDHQFIELRRSESLAGKELIRFQQFYKGVPLADVQVIVHLKDGKVIGMNGTPRRASTLDVRPVLTEEEALASAVQAIGSDKYMWEDPLNESFLKAEQKDPSASFLPKGELVISAGHNLPAPENLRLVYRFDVYSAEPFSYYRIDIDARNGEEVGRTTLLHTDDVPSSSLSLYNGTVDMIVDSLGPNSYRMREEGRGGGVRTFDMQRSENYSQAVDFTSESSSFLTENDQAGVNAHWATEASYDYFLEHHNRDSYDNNGALLRSYVHFSTAYDNAFWDGSRMTFGDGSTFSPLTTLDVVAHELAHGVTQFSAGLVYANEYGALNESFSDIFGAAVEFDKIGNDANWLIGEDMTASGLGIRSMNNPNANGDPDTYMGSGWAPLSNTPNGSNDQGGVHTNSGVQNHWFYLLSVGGSGVNDNGFTFNVQALGIDQAAEIAYRNLTTYLTPLSEYEDARLGAMNSAIDLFGESSLQFQAVVDAWDAVGVEKPSLTAKLALDADTLEYLTETNFASDTSRIEIANYGLTLLTIDGVTISGSDFELINGNTFPVTLDYEETIFVDVVFTPTVDGDATGEISVQSDDPNAISIVALKGLGFTINEATSGINYGIGNVENGSALYRLADDNLATSVIAENHYSDIRGLTLNPADNILYASMNVEGVANIVQVDADAAFVASRAEFDDVILRSIAFDGAGNLYGSHYVNGTIYQLDMASETATEIGVSGIPLLYAITYDPLNDQLLGANVLGNIYAIDKTTAASTLLGSSGFNQMVDLKYVDENLLMALTGTNGNENQIVAIDTDTYAGRSVRFTGVSDVTSLVFDGSVVSIDADPDLLLPQAFSLDANYPNPFNPSTTIRYALPIAADVELAVFNTLGQRVATLIDDRQAAGYKTAVWNGTDDTGNEVASGIYIYRLTAESFRKSAKMMLMK